MADIISTCPICGEPTFMVYGKYPRKDGLCKEHSQDLFNKKIELNEDGLFVDVKTKKVLNKQHKQPDSPKKEPKTEFLFWDNPPQAKKKEESKVSTDIPPRNQTTTTPVTTPDTPAQEEGTNRVVIINEENKSRCITCGRKTDGLLFCGICYREYHNKELLFKITKCSSVELLDEDYEGRYTCKDGHVVKSKSEREIDNYLFENGIPHAYEKPLPYGKTEKEVLHPDFYLPHYLGKGKHVFIEHWGYDDNNRDYTKTKKFKMPIYEKLGITLICTYEKTDTGDIEATLDRKLAISNIDENTINFK